jgi:hypothetical protein
VALATAPPPRATALLDRFDVRKLRAAIFPLSHLDVTFAGVPPLDELFPPLGRPA